MVRYRAWLLHHGNRLTWPVLTVWSRSEVVQAIASAPFPQQVLVKLPSETDMQTRRWWAQLVAHSTTGLCGKGLQKYKQGLDSLRAAGDK